MLTREAVIMRARALGFDLCGIARADRHPRLARLQEWIEAGRAGHMTYLAESLDERLDPTHVLPTARTVISLAVAYQSDAPRATAISRYAWGDDYHDIVRARLTPLVQWMADAAGRGFEAFSCVDNGPVQERVFAEQAGLGWIGKNTCLINPRLGSWIFLAEVLTNADLEPDAPALDQCGACTKCLEACPTGAIVAPYELDATRCLSYLTIEVRGSVEARWRGAIREQIYGCDICQDVCPWNRRAPVSPDAAWAPREGLAAPRLLDLCRLSDEAWRRLIKGSAMRRAGLRRIRRSLAYAAGALAPAEAAAGLDALEAHPSAQAADVAEAIAWARSRRGP